MGAIEATLVTVLTGAGVESSEALSIVAVFRLLTYWLPILSAWLALRYLRCTRVV